MENYLEDKRKMPTFALRMRVAYRRDYIKLRNHSLIYKAVGRVPSAFVVICMIRLD